MRMSFNSLPLAVAVEHIVGEPVDMRPRDLNRISELETQLQNGDFTLVVNLESDVIPQPDGMFIHTNDKVVYLVQGSRAVKLFRHTYFATVEHRSEPYPEIIPPMLMPEAA